MKLFVAGIETTFSTVDSQYTIICEKLNFIIAGGGGDLIVSSIESIIAVSKVQVKVIKSEISLLGHYMHHNNVHVSIMIRLYCSILKGQIYLSRGVLLL